MKLLISLLILLTASAGAQPVTDAQVSAWRTQMRAALYIPEKLPALDVESYGTFNASPEVIAERVSYRTEYGVRVPAIVYRPAKTVHGPMPGMVLVDGHGGDKTSWYSYYTAMLYAQAGAVVVTYDAIGTGEASDEHKAGDNEHDKPIETPASMPQRMGGRMIADVLQGVSYLEQRGDVDGHRIALLGFSMGSFHAALAGALDARVHALLLTGGGDLDGPGGYWQSSHAVMCQSGPYKALSFLGDVPTALFTMNARRGDTLIVNGTIDTVVDIPNHGPEFFNALRDRVVTRNGSERGVFRAVFDPGASHRPNWMTRDDAEWLEAELPLPNWPSAAAVAKLPTETMRVWAERVGYALGKSSGREDRDAGLVMLKADVPLLSQEQLNILPAADWQRRKADFIYSTWVQRALADAKGNQ